MLCNALLVAWHYTHAQGLVITSGAKLVANGDVKLVLNDAGITSNGTIIPSTSTFIFSGSSAGTSFVAGSATSSFYNLTMNKTANGLQLNTNIEVSNTLSLAGGDSLFLNNYNIAFGSTGTLSGETETRRITGYNGGYIEAIATLNAPTLSNPGNLGFVISSLQNLGATTVRRGHAIQAGGSVRRYYDITPTNNTNLNATVVFNYLENELNENSEAFLDFFSSIDEGLNWTNEGVLDNNTVLNYIAADFDSFDRLTIGNQPNLVLPLRSVLLTGTATAQYSTLQWTASGISASGVCVIEKSADATLFTAVATVPYSIANGTKQQFTYIDKNINSGKNFYRIKAVNQLGKVFYSNAIMLQNSNQVQCSIHPNPAKGSVQINAGNIAATSLSIGIYTLNGQLMIQQNIPVTAQQIKYRLDITSLPAGVYVVRSATIPQLRQLLTVY